MRHHIMRKFTLVCLGIGLVAFFGSAVVVGFYWFGITAPGIMPLATTVMILTLALQLAFIMTQLVPEGRQLVDMRFFGPDVWMSILSLTIMPGVLWHHISAFAATFMQGIMPGYATPALNALLFMIARLVQQRNYRDLVRPSAPPTA